jgi:hypothetical protein
MTKEDIKKQAQQEEEDMGDDDEEEENDENDEDDEDNEEEENEEEDEDGEAPQTGVSDDVRRSRWFSDPMFQNLSLQPTASSDEDNDEDAIRSMKANKSRSLADRLQAYRTCISFSSFFR